MHYIKASSVSFYLAMCNTHKKKEQAHHPATSGEQTLASLATLHHISEVVAVR